MTSVEETAFPFSALEHRVMEFLSVPSAPEVPDGSAASIRVFRAGEKFYAWLVFVWAVGTAGALFGLASMTIALVQIGRRGTGWVQILLTALGVLLWSAFLLYVVVSFLSRRLNFRLRWYIVTDRSVRIRSGVFSLTELTMTYRNIQEIRVTAGPLQHALGLATVEVHAAGGGGGQGKHSTGGHVGRLEGLSNAAEIRDLIVDRLRVYRDAGLGDAPHTEHVDAATDLAAATAMLSEVRALRAALTRSPSLGRSG